MPPDARAARTEWFPRTAIPVFMGRVSPVLDMCTRLCLLEPARREGIGRKMMLVRGKTIFERAEEIKRLGVCVVICGAVSNPFYNLLTERSVDIVCGITGDIDEVIMAYQNGRLEQARFRMPGAE